MESKAYENELLLLSILKSMAIFHRRNFSCSSSSIEHVLRNIMLWSFVFHCLNGLKKERTVAS